MFFSIYKFSLAKTTLKIDLFIRIKEVVHNVIALCRLLFLNKDQVVSKNKKKDQYDSYYSIFISFHKAYKMH